MPSDTTTTTVILHASTEQPIGDIITTLRDAMAYHTAVVVRCKTQPAHSLTETAGLSACASMHEAYAVALGHAIRRLHPLR